jgi:L,D-transpeptidase YcbB
VALYILGRAPDVGLAPADFDVADFRQAVAAIDAGHSTAAERRSFDEHLSGRVLRYLRQLHLGRVDPRRIGFKLSIPADQHDFVHVLRDALAADRLTRAAAEMTPPLVQYRLLRAMLARYRTLSAGHSLQFPPASAPIHPGDRYAALAQLSGFLEAVGDLTPGSGPPGETTRYEGLIVDGVKRFQIRHGLEADGVIGASTHAALRVPLAWRVRQIELALERLRWLPDLGDRRFIALNIPMFQLWGWDAIPPTGEPAFGMRAIVGRARVTQTPIFVAEMDHLIFRPYWNVPRSILLGEILPQYERNANTPARSDFEIVRGEGDDARPLEMTPANLALLRRGVLRLWQRPGPNNALGLVKFVFPNDSNVYLHGTPTQALFSRSRRDFSHGCVRVEDPAALAAWVLGDQPDWTRARILDAMSGTTSVRVNLTQPIPIVLFYMTAAVMPEDGTVRFAEDVYGHDKTLDRMLIAGGEEQ